MTAVVGDFVVCRLRVSAGVFLIEICVAKVATANIARGQAGAGCVIRYKPAT